MAAGSRRRAESSSSSSSSSSSCPSSFFSSSSSSSSFSSSFPRCPPAALLLYPFTMPAILAVLLLLFFSSFSFTSVQAQVQVQPVVNVSAQTAPPNATLIPDLVPSQTQSAPLPQQSAAATAFLSSAPVVPSAAPTAIASVGAAIVSAQGAIPSFASNGVMPSVPNVMSPDPFPANSLTSALPSAPAVPGVPGTEGGAPTIPNPAQQSAPATTVPAGLLNGVLGCGLPDPHLPKDRLNFPFDCAATVSNSLRIFWTKADPEDPVIRFGALFTAKGFVAIGFGTQMINGTALIVLANNEARVVTMLSRSSSRFDDHYENVIPLRHKAFLATVDRATVPPTASAVTYAYVTFYVYIRNTVKPLDITQPIDMIYAFSDEPQLTYHDENRGTFKVLLQHPTQAQSSASAPLMHQSHQ